MEKSLFLILLLFNFFILFELYFKFWLRRDNLLDRLVIFIFNSLFLVNLSVGIRFVFFENIKILLVIFLKVIF